MSYRPGIVSVIVHALNFLSSFKYAEKFSIVENFFLERKKYKQMQKEFVQKETKKFIQN
jgi:ribosome biogenesis protein Tsr3